jgi:hypothetical protein
MEGYLHNFKEIEKGRGPSPLNPMECGFSCMRTCSMSVISSSYFLLSAITDRFNARNQLNMSLSENRLSSITRHHIPPPQLRKSVGVPCDRR